MAFLIAAVVLVGMLCTLDLVLTLGVIKRLREHTDQLSELRGLGAAPVIATGEQVADFSTSTVDGEELCRETLDGETLVAFFSPTCEPCKKKMPAFVEYARTFPGGRKRVVAAVVGDSGLAGPFVAELAPVARVVVEEDTDSALSAACQVAAFPTVLRVAPDTTGRLVVTANDMELDQPVAAPA
ncbi:TlpA disulfide reductase family protein [Streptomyces sp. NRRL S-474]|uniref:TlpA disulfide reductase family protein n=1 Tax=Streptomyces sp. NRRL S-474 TaxID=1463909 RepID=UPI0004C54077|nr:TlpA disulfide reductase family protein [Streptomyces sp. NRRL S-474]